MTEDERYPADLTEKVQAGGITPFVGSGLSIPSGVPSWSDLLNDLLEESHRNGHDVTALRPRLSDGRLSAVAAAALFHTLSTKFAVRQLIQSRINQPWKPNVYHQLLVKLPSDVVITTNWDCLIEQGYQESRIALQKIWRDEHLAHFNTREAIQLVKIHGTVDDINSVVFAEDEYESYRANHKHLYTFLSSVVLTQTLLFLGFSGRDPNIRTLLETIRNDMNGITRRHYAVMCDADADDVSELNRIGVRVINLPSGGDRTGAVGTWLRGLVDRSRVIVPGNKSKAETVNTLIRRYTQTGLPGDAIRMRAALGILSNPKQVVENDPIYGSVEQDRLETEMGERARAFLRRDARNQIRCILHVDPLHQRRKGYLWRHLERRFRAMLEFMDEFGGQVDMVHSPVPIDMNQVIVGGRWSATSFKRGEVVGYDRLSVTPNRWVIDADIRGFDQDFDGLRALNRSLADRMGIDTTKTAWPEMLSRRILELAIEMAARDQSVLQCDPDGNVIGSISREHAHKAGVMHRSIHLHVFDGSEGDLQVLVQRRHPSADLYGGQVDVSVAGHPETPDSLRELVREAREELALDIDPGEIRHFGLRSRQEGSDREVVDIYFIERHGLSKQRPHLTREVEALHWIRLRGRDEELVATGWTTFGSLEIPTTAHLRLGEFVPGAIDEIFEVAARLR